MDQRRNIIFTKATELQLQGFNISSILGENDVIRFLSLATEKKKALVHEIEEVKVQLLVD